MYRCTECKTVYQECPDYCDCGNDTFEEIDDKPQKQAQEYYDDDEEVEIPPPPKKKKRKMTPEEAAEYYEEQVEKKKSLIAAGVFLVLIILAIFVFPPHVKHKMDAVKEKVSKENIQIPSIETYWDDTVPSAFKSEDPLANLPVLNSSFSSISPVLRNYLGYLGKEFDSKWNKNMIQSDGSKLYTTTVVFTINKEGLLNVKRIISKSDNESLDNSVSLALTNVTNVDVPPDDYKGEKVYITFNCDKDKSTFIKYPTRVK